MSRKTKENGCISWAIPGILTLALGVTAALGLYRNYVATGDAASANATAAILVKNLEKLSLKQVVQETTIAGLVQTAQKTPAPISKPIVTKDTPIPLPTQGTIILPTVTPSPTIEPQNVQNSEQSAPNLNAESNLELIQLAFAASTDQPQLDRLISDYAYALAESGSKSVDSDLLRALLLRWGFTITGDFKLFGGKITDKNGNPLIEAIGIKPTGIVQVLGPNGGCQLTFNDTFAQERLQGDLLLDPYEFGPENQGTLNYGGALILTPRCPGTALIRASSFPQ